MPATTPRGYPYPTEVEPSAGDEQLEALARAVDTDVSQVAAAAAALILHGAQGSVPADLPPGTVYMGY